MSDENEDEKRIEPPKANKKRALARTVAEGVAGLAPGGGIATGILRVTHPTKAEQDRETWEQVVSERTNEHSDRLDEHEAQLSHKETISGVTAQLIAALAKDCPDGLGHEFYDLDRLSGLLLDEDRQELEDAAFELEALGLVDFHRSINGPWRLSLSPDFYEQVDHQVMDWATEEDAIALARLMLELDTGNAPTLHEKTGWPKRRFNPALRYLLPLFPEGRVRRVIQPDYVTMGVALAPEDKAALRRLVKKHG
ncbi:MAG: hypothetical protein RLW87_08590 [Alphaproteobacteria bacterium]